MLIRLVVPKFRIDYACRRLEVAFPHRGSPPSSPPDMLHIRPIQKEDLPALAKIYAKTYEAFDVGERWTAEAAQKLLAYDFKK